MFWGLGEKTEGRGNERQLIPGRTAEKGAGSTPSHLNSHRTIGEVVRKKLRTRN